MTITKRSFIAVAVAAGLGAGLGPASAQEDYPNQEINWIIPFSPGSGADNFARTLIEPTQEILGQSIVPLNREGGGSSIGVAYAAAQPADGYTIFSQSDTIALGLASGQWPVKIEEIQAVARINADYKTLIVPAASPFETFEEFVAHAQENPGSLRVGGVGSRSWSSFFVDKLTTGADIEVTYVPYDGGSKVVSAVLGENIDAAVITSSNVNEQVDAGELRMLAQSLSERAPERPEVPTFVELGVEEIDGDLLWRGVFAPAGTPEHVLQALSSALEEATEDERWKSYMKNQRQQNVFMPYDEFQKYFEDSVAEYRKAFGTD